MVNFQANISMTRLLLTDDLTSITDLHLLKFQLNQEREKLFSISNFLIKTELSYGNILLRIDYEKLLTKHKQLNEEYHSLKIDYQHLGHACLYLINKTHDLIEERNKYYNEWETNKACLTPRPDWDKVSNVIDGGIERWKLLSIEKTSEQLMEILIREIINGNQMNSIKEQDDFRSEGDDLSVLPFLRMPKYTRVINRRIRRRLTGLLIKEIWADKIENLTRTSSLLSPDLDSNSIHKTLADHVAVYFEKRFHSKSIAIEMGYNLRDACERYRNSEQINLFWGIITGQIEEFVYHHQMKSISQLLQHLMKINNRIFTNEQFIESLKLFYPTKTSSQIDELILSAKHDLQYPSESIEFSLLFLEDDEGRFGEFLSTLIKQINEEKISYIEQIKQILLGYPLISVSQFSRAIYMIDPKISPNELHRYIEWTFLIKNVHSSQQIKPIDLEDLLRRLENCACFKH